MSESSHRVTVFDGGAIDRSRALEFFFDGRSYSGFAGDSLASALLANGVRLVGRSFKYHRRRGILSAALEEPNALVQLGDGAITEPNRQATRVELYEGLRAYGQNAVPSLRYDILGALSWFSGLFPSGFYYKTFMWPRRMWMRYEAIIRHIAGLGKAPREPDPEHYDRRHAHCDILVVGGGAAGLTAAYGAAMSGADVILAHEDCRWGGSLLYTHAEIDHKPATEWISHMVAQLAAMPNVTLLLRTTVNGYYDYDFATATERVSDHIAPADRQHKIRQRFWKIKSRHTILAQGAVERPLVFGNNDLPGIMLASAMREYLHRYQILCGHHVAIFTNNDSAYGCAMDLQRAGAKVTLIDPRRTIADLLQQDLQKNNIDYRLGSVVLQASGKASVKGVYVGAIDANENKVSGDVSYLACDALAMSGGFTPTVHLYSQAGGKLKYNADLGILVPDGARTPHNSRCSSIGGSNGTFGLAATLTDATETTHNALTACGFKPSKTPPPHTSDDPMALHSIRLLWRVPPMDKAHNKSSRLSAAKAFVDFQNDVTAADIELAHREGYESVEHLKRYTTTGMGTDQGKTSNMNALALLAACRAIPIEQVGNTTFRPPYSPITFGAIAGRNRGSLFQQERMTAMHSAHVGAGAIFEDVGDWKRARYFPQGDETMFAAVPRESRQVRETVGMMDASTLGKVDIQGEDSVRLLNWVYTNAWDNLGIGRSRYGVMLNEDGMIFDDGVTTRLGEHHFHMTTTTGGAARVLTWIEEWLQTEWPHMRVRCTSVTEQWAVATVSGPLARSLLSDVCDIDLSAESFPFMSMQEGSIGGIAARIFRISFTGDLAYEINVPAGYGLALWDLLRRVGERYDLCLYGTESMHLLRAEKGFLIVGQDTDGTVTPYDAGLDWLVSKKKEDFLGKRSLLRSDTGRSDRKQLVGILTEDPHIVLPEGAHIVENLRASPPMAMLGHITSSYYSPNCERSIAMALVRDGFSRRGERYFVSLMDGSSVAVRIADSAIFFDEKGERRDG